MVVGGGGVDDMGFTLTPLATPVHSICMATKPCHIAGEHGESYPDLVIQIGQVDRFILGYRSLTMRKGGGRVSRPPTPFLSIKPPTMTHCPAARSPIF